MARLYLSSNEIAPTTGHVPSLDGLRAISILLVLIAHFVTPKIPGGVGVYIFFVISGFLITRLLLAELASTGGISLPRFYARRFLRLFPAILVYTAVVTNIALFLKVDFRISEPLAALFYSTNYLVSWFRLHGIPETMPFGTFWSLSVEEHFYFLFPLAVLLTRGKPARLALVCLSVCLLCLIFRILAMHFHPEYASLDVIYMRSEYRLDSIAFGVLISVASASGLGRLLLPRLSHPMAVAGAVGIVLLCLGVRNEWFRETLRYTLLGSAIAVLMAAVLFSGRYKIAQQFLNAAPMVWIGKLSYSLYVWHLAMTLLFHGPMPEWQRILGELTASFAAAALSYYLVETPVLKLRQQLSAPRAKIRAV